MDFSRLGGMDMMQLLGAMQQNQPQEQIILFAGQMKLVDNKMTPDLRKGKIIVYLDSQPDLIKFEYHLRPSNEKLLDLIIPVNTAPFLQIKDCITGRVFVLRFKEPSKRYYFWLQNATTTNDTEIIAKINKLLLQDYSPEEYEKLCASVSSVPPPYQSSQNEDKEEKAATIANFSDAIEAITDLAQPISLSSILDFNTILPILLDDEKIVNNLISLLPDSLQTKSELNLTVHTPQLSSLIDYLSHIINSPYCCILLRNFGIECKNEDVGMRKFINLVNQHFGKK